MNLMNYLYCLFFKLKMIIVQAEKLSIQQKNQLNNSAPVFLIRMQ